MKNIFHHLIQIHFSNNYNVFKNNLDALQEIQLKKINSSYREYTEKFPLTNYDSYEAMVLELKDKGQRCVPTSGSTNQLKWIPYTKNFNQELAMATHPWLYDVYQRFPEVMQGKHFWSMSWLPENLRNTQTTDDLSYFSIFEKFVMRNIMAIDESISHLPTVESSMLRSLQILIDEDISLISVWSPTFLLEMLDMIFSHKIQLLSMIKNKSKKEYILKSKELNEELTMILFPKLKLISAWDTSTSKLFANKIKNLFPMVNFQGKGLFATEGVVSIPFQEKMLLSYCSHFYEFEDLASGKVYPSFEVSKGMKAKVIISTGNGFKRYQLNDVVEILGFEKSIPVINFIGRDREVDLVGEKLNHKVFLTLIDSVYREFGLKILTFIGNSSGHPGYQAIIELDNNQSISLEKKAELVDFIEKNLNQFFHYRLAREANQLSSIEILTSQNALQLYHSKIKDIIQIKGNVKVEPVIII